jgi:Escherichia/Staphylococcus phage prohead protease
MKIDHKGFAFEIKADDGEGILEAIVSVVGNVDRMGDRVMPGFFAKSLQTKLPRAVWAHDMSKPIAKTLAAQELRAGDPRLPEKLRTAGFGGYYVKARFVLGTQTGREAYELVRAGAIDEFSIGFITKKSRWNEATKTHDLIEGEWLEWSPVIAGMNTETAVISVKSDHDSLALDQARSDYARHQALLAEIELLLL